jgi:glycosyltransferase involved in cell wall biosynthesis
MYISWIIPAYNEEKRIEKTIRDVDAYLKSKQFPGGYEIIVSDSASRDRTAALVEGLMREIPALRIINLKNRGKGWAVREGMRAALGEIRGFSDADNSVSPEQADSVLANLCLPTQAGLPREEGRPGGISPCFDIVIGSIEVQGAKVEEQAQWYRRLLGHMAKLLIRVVSGVWEARDSQRGFKFFSKQAAEVIFPMQTLTGWGFDFEVLLIGKRNGFHIKEIPVRWINPPDSKVRLNAYLTTLIELMRVKWNDIRGIYRRRAKV